MPGGIVKTNACESAASCVALGAWAAPCVKKMFTSSLQVTLATNQGEANLPKSRNKIVAGGSNVAGVGKVALVQIIAPRPVPSQALGAHPALVVRGLLYVVTLNIFKARSRHFLADVRHTICSVTSVPLHATKIA